jgi:hypothetical protein
VEGAFILQFAPRIDIANLHLRARGGAIGEVDGTPGYACLNLYPWQGYFIWVFDQKYTILNLCCTFSIEK